MNGAALIIGIIFLFVTIWVVAPMIIFGYLRRRKLDSTEKKRIEALEAERDQYRERIRHLESMVCDMNRELTGKLDRLASRQPAALPRSPQPSQPSQHSPDTPRTSETAYSPTQIAPSLRPPSLLEPGDRLAGRFQVVRSLGAGGMGEVFEARDEVLGETVALKVLSALASLEPEAVERFRREAVAARRISHPNVVRLYDIGEDRDIIFLSMEYVPGTTLAERIRRQGRLDPAEVRSLGEQICDALEAAHGRGVVHRDLKPHNILIDQSDRFRVIDFGVAKLPYLQGLTTTGLVLGTPEYMAPEQIRGGQVDGRSDLYSLGAIVFHALTGRPPFTGESAIAIGFAHCNQEIPSVKSAHPDLSEAWDTVLQRALAKDPAERFESAAAFRAALP